MLLVACKIARQLEVRPVLCRHWTLGGVSFHYQSVMEADAHFPEMRCFVQNP
jgi:hypothetical protein